jgi:tRNA nucleotidyltransferase (CCA-adding enzyme)
MLNYLTRLPREVLDLIYLVGHIAYQANIPAYLVGGFVRDLILGVKNLDLDIVVEGDGIKFAQALAQCLGAKITAHKRFGTATVYLKNNLKVDIATARSEVYPKPAHLPIVRPGRLQDDLFRRDFGINCLAMSINQADFGRIIDLYGAKEDLRRRRIRILHGLSFIDDPTRILRGVRFAARYNFRLEAGTRQLLEEALKSKMLDKVQPQRTRDEIILLLKEDKPLKALQAVQKLSGFSFISPRLKFNAQAQRLFRAASKEICAFNRDYSQRRALDTWLIYLMALWDELSVSEAASLCQKFAFQRGETKRILSYKKLNRRFIRELSQRGIKPSRIFSLLEPLSYEVIILVKAKYKNKILRRHISDFLEIYNGMRVLVRGHDLHGLGLKPGPGYQKIFSRVLTAKLDGGIKTKEEELRLIKELLR